MSIIKKLIVNADAESRYLTPGEMDQIKSFVMSGDRRLRLVKTLTESRDRIVKASGKPVVPTTTQLCFSGWQRLW